LLHARNDADHDAHGRADYFAGRSLNVAPLEALLARSSNQAQRGGAGDTLHRDGQVH
jgi:hypothetical protein